MPKVHCIAQYVYFSAQSLLLGVYNRFSGLPEEQSTRPTRSRDQFAGLTVHGGPFLALKFSSCHSVLKTARFHSFPDLHCVAWMAINRTSSTPDLEEVNFSPTSDRNVCPALW